MSQIRQDDYWVTNMKRRWRQRFGYRPGVRQERPKKTKWTCQIPASETSSKPEPFEQEVTWGDRYFKAGDTLSSRHVSSYDVNACSWDVRDDLTLNSMVQIDTSVTLLTSRDLAWSSGRLKCQQRLSNFCCRTHFVKRDVRFERSSDVTSCFQKWRKCLLKKCANWPFYMTPSHQIIEMSIWEPTHGNG